MFNYRNREQAGRQLSLELVKYSAQNPIILAISEGGIPVAFEVARALNAALDVFVTQRLGVPGHEELPFGAIGEDQSRFIDQDVVRSVRITFGETEMVVRAAAAEVNRRALIYRNGEPLPEILNRTVILIDDGIATGYKAKAAILAIRALKPRSLILAAPVVARPAAEDLRELVDSLVVLHSAPTFYTAGQFYEKYPDLEEHEILSLLRISENFPHHLTIPDEVPPAA